MSDRGAIRMGYDLSGKYKDATTNTGLFRIETGLSMLNAPEQPSTEVGLVEYYTVPVWSQGQPANLLHEKMKLVPPLEYFDQKARENLAEILKPKPTMKPIVRRARRNAIPQTIPLVHTSTDTPSSTTVLLSSEIARGSEIPLTKDSTTNIIVKAQLPPSSPNPTECSLPNINNPTPETPPTVESLSVLVAPVEYRHHAKAVIKTQVAGKSNTGALHKVQSSQRKSNSPKQNSPRQQRKTSLAEESGSTSLRAMSSIESRCPTNTSKRAQTARKSTASKSAIRHSTPRKHAALNPRVVCIDIIESDLYEYVEPLLREHFAATGGKAAKLYERKDSTDSGLGPDIPVEPIPKLRINFGDLIHHYTPKDQMSSGKTSASTSSKSKKRRIDMKSNFTSCTMDGPKMKRKRTTKTKSSRKSQKPGKVSKTQNHGSIKVSRKPATKNRPSIPVSIPLADGMTMKVDWQRRIRDKNNNNNSSSSIVKNTTSLPTDVVPTSELDLSQLMVSTYKMKRYLEPPALLFFNSFNEAETLICISCNRRFQTSHDLASHKLAHHQSFNY